MKEIKRDFRILGAKEFLKRAIYLRHDYLIYSIEFKGTHDDADQTIELEVIEENPEEIIERLKNHQDESMRNFAAMFRENLKSKFRGFIATKNSNIAGFKWWVDKNVSFSRIDLQFIRDEAPMEEDDVYSFGLFVAESYRGMGVARNMQIKFCKEMEKLGYCRGFSYVRSDNIPSRKVFERTGWKVLKMSPERRFFLFLYCTAGRIIASKKYLSVE